MPERYPGYDVMAKRHTPSWNEATRRAIDHRLSLPREPHFFTADEWQTLSAVCDRIVPQPAERPPVPLPAMIDHKMTQNMTGRLPQRTSCRTCRKPGGAACTHSTPKPKPVTARGSIGSVPQSRTPC